MDVRVFVWFECAEKGDGEQCVLLFVPGEFRLRISVWHSTLP